MKSVAIQNTKGLVALVDDEDFDKVSAYRWLTYASRGGYEYAVAQIDGKRVYMHRLLAGVDGLHVDHINGHTLDNRRSNLRAVTPVENSRNRHSRRSSALGIAGVYRHRNKFLAKSSAHGPRIYLGCFETIDEAKNAQRIYEESAAGKETIPSLIARVAMLEQQVAAMKAVA